MKSMFLFFYFFSRFYSVDAWVNSYAKTISPVGNEDDWVVLNDIKQIKILKPAYCLKAGRPKANCRPSHREKKGEMVAEEKVKAQKRELELQIELLKARHKLELQEKRSNG